MQRAVPGRRLTAPRDGPEVTGVRVLIVEDEYVVALEMATALREAGFDVAGIASSAADALRLADLERPDLAIMDVRLAGPSDGVSAAREIFARHGIRSIMATAHYDQSTRERAGAEAAADWVRKPFTSAALVACVRRVLAGQARKR